MTEALPSRPVATSSLEDAVRELMVVLHACKQLPPHIAEAAGAVHGMLPAGLVSDDNSDTAILVDEAMVLAGQLDCALGNETFLGGDFIEVLEPEEDESATSYVARVKKSGGKSGGRMVLKTKTKP